MLATIAAIITAITCSTLVVYAELNRRERRQLTRRIDQLDQGDRDCDTTGWVDVASSFGKRAAGDTPTQAPHPVIELRPDTAWTMVSLTEGGLAIMEAEHRDGPWTTTVLVREPGGGGGGGVEHFTDNHGHGAHYRNQPTLEWCSDPTCMREHAAGVGECVHETPNPVVSRDTATAITDAAIGEVVDTLDRGEDAEPLLDAIAAMEDRGQVVPHDLVDRTDNEPERTHQELDVPGAAINGYHPDGTRRCGTEHCNASPAPWHRYCVACNAEAEANGQTIVFDERQAKVEATAEDAETVTTEQVRSAPDGRFPDDVLVRIECDTCDWTTATTDPVALVDQHLDECPGLAASREAARITTDPVVHAAIAATPPPVSTAAAEKIRERRDTFAAVPSSSRKRTGDPIAPAATALQPGRSTPAPKTVTGSTERKVDSPMPVGWVDLNEASEYIGVPKKRLQVAIDAGALAGKRHPSAGRYGYKWIVQTTDLDHLYPSSK